MDVMCYEVFAEEREALARYLPSGIAAGFACGAVQAQAHGAPPARVICTRTQSVIPAEWAAQLTGVLSRSAGYDHLAAFQRRAGRRVACGYLPRYCARAVAEQAVAMMLALARRLPKQIRQLRVFDRDRLTGIECASRMLLVVGVGHIGREIAALGSALGMRVNGVDQVPRETSLDYVRLEDGLREADVIVCALPLTALTIRLLDYERLRAAKPGALFINVGRGEVAPLSDLRRLLDEGRLSGVGLDVYEDEPALADYLRTRRGDAPPGARTLLAMLDDDRVLATPHNAFNTGEALERKARQSAEAIVAFLSTGRFPHPLPDDAFTSP